MTRRFDVVRFAALVLYIAVPPHGAAQDSLPPQEGGVTASLGQPPRLKTFAGGSFGLDWRDAGPVVPTTLATFGLFKDISSPVTSLLALSVEGFAGVRADKLDGGARALLVSNVLRLSAGVEYNARSSRFAPLLGVSMPVRRGGVFGGGTLLRAEWSPGPGDAARLTVLAPLRQPHAGRTRPRSDRVDVAPRLSAQSLPVAVPALDSALDHLRRAALRIQELVVPYIDAPGSDPAAALAPSIARLRAPPRLPLAVEDSGLNVDATVRLFHAELQRAFAIAATGEAVELGASTPLGDSLAQIARRNLLVHVLLPFDRLLGQRKTDRTLLGLSAYARGGFVRDLSHFTALRPPRPDAVTYVFVNLLETLEVVRAGAERAWGDNRLTWLPLQFALRPEDHDTQEELDRIVEMAVAQDFTDGNKVQYVINEQFATEVIRTINEARDYHVLWIHDFRGRNDQDRPDAQSLRYVVDAYLQALTERVREYDRRGVLPVYLIFLDQHYYEVNKGRLWLDFLEHPLDSLPHLAPEFAEFRERVRQAQVALRAAVRDSRLLQSEARQFGGAWLANLIKVQVSITNPADPSFWAHGLLPLIGTPDNVMRDHRKIALYDITEADPYRGKAIYTGMGVGEHYAGPTWEDRAIMVQGPALLTLKRQARTLLLSQGMRADQVPFPLRPAPVPDGYAAAVRDTILALALRGERDQRAMELHNGTGYADKPINVAKAVLYSLVPPGAVIKVPDSLWGSTLFASLLCGSAFRGVRILFIAPSLPSAPSSGWPAMGIAHDLFARLIVLQHALGPELEAAGGFIKTGIYNPGIAVQDIYRRLDAAYRNGRRTPFLRRLLPIDPSLDTLFAGLAPMLAQDTAPASRPRRAVVPKLHLKANFFASQEGWDQLIRRPEFMAVVLAYIRTLTGGQELTPEQAADTLRQASQALVDAFNAQLDPAQRARVLYYLMVGSANQDYRSMFMDGEASVLLSGWSGVVGVIDFALITNLSVWVDDLQMLDDLLPPPHGLKRGLSRWARPLM